ncbi:hypothetical protein [Actinoplanes sp. NPDC026623]|uniref:hypothetical protein n=1 Tax=Actinoplanes sp. NPDC026623 TaxID=3155610 RepID=UPI0033D5CFEB
MTGAEFSGVDVDLLADYVGGALDGTPDEAVVAALIADDPAWRDAHALLDGGVATVTAGLRALGAAPESMPADIVARLDAALSEASAAPDSPLETPADVIPIGEARGRSPGRAPAAATPMRPGGDGTAPEVRPVGVPSDARRSWTRRLRVAAPIGVAAGVLAFLGFSVQQFGGAADSETSSAGIAADQAPRSAPDLELALPDGSAPITDSGIDYSRATLSQAGARAMAAPIVPDKKNGSSRNSLGATSAKTADELNGLRVHEALLACIDAIAGESGLAPITAQSVEFARYDGAPAVAVQFTAPGGSWVWAVGPRCGTPGVGADKLASVQVG